MAKGKLVLSEKPAPKNPGRKKHSWKVVGANGEHVSGSTPSQAFFNAEDRENNMRITYEALKEHFENQ